MFSFSVVYLSVVTRQLNWQTCMHAVINIHATIILQNNQFLAKQLQTTHHSQNYTGIQVRPGYRLRLKHE